MRLSDLKPFFVRYEVRPPEENSPVRGPNGEPIPQRLHVRVATIEEAQGIRFTCPRCQSHQVVCWSESRGIGPEVTPGPGRWAMSGTGFDDLTLTGDNGRSSSVDCGCWHGHVTNGAIVGGI